MCPCAAPPAQEKKTAREMIRFALGDPFVRRPRQYNNIIIHFALCAKRVLYTGHVAV